MRGNKNLHGISCVACMLLNAVSALAQGADAFGYDDYAKVLSAHVNDRGEVNYKGLKADRGDLDRFIQRLGALKPQVYQRWGAQAKIAFWSNAYNAITLKYIIDAYPIPKGGFIASLRYPANSIRQIDGVWDAKTTRVMGKPTTLDAIEHEILRKQFNEPRIHMAIVCASAGCPFLRNEPYAADKLDRQLKEQSQKFLSSPDKFRMQLQGDKQGIYLSPIFNWFGEDFIKSYAPPSGFDRYNETEQAALNFVRRHLDKKKQPRFNGLLDKPIYWLDYDWSLNEQR